MSIMITAEEVTEAHKLITRHMDQLINECVDLYIAKMEDKFPHLKQDAQPALTIVPDSDTVT